MEINGSGKRRPSARNMLMIQTKCKIVQNGLASIKNLLHILSKCSAGYMKQCFGLKVKALSITHRGKTN